MTGLVSFLREETLQISGGWAPKVRTKFFVFLYFMCIAFLLTSNKHTKNSIVLKSYTQLDAYYVQLLLLLIPTNLQLMYQDFHFTEEKTSD